MNVSFHTPDVVIRDARGLTVREIQHHRHPQSPDETSTRITCHRYDTRGILMQSADPRLHEAGLANFSYLTDLTGNILRTQGADSGTSVVLNDVAGRPSMTVSNIRTADTGLSQLSRAVRINRRVECPSAIIGTSFSIRSDVRAASAPGRSTTSKTLTGSEAFPFRSQAMAVSTY